MAILSRFRDLIALGRLPLDDEDPSLGGDYAPDPDMIAPMPQDSQQTDPYGGETVTGGVQGPKRPGFGSRLLAGLPGIIDSGIVAAAHRNTAGGGPSDFFGALKDADADREAKQQQEVDRVANNNAMDNYRQGHLSNEATANALRGALGGFQIVIPQGHPAARMGAPVATSEGPDEGSGEAPPPVNQPAPVVSPIPEDQYSPKQKADLEKKRKEAALAAARTGLTDADTDLAGARTEDVKQHTALAPDILALRQKMAGMTLMRIGNERERIAMAKAMYNFNYKGVDENGEPVFQDDQGNAISPRLYSMTKLSGAAQAKIAQAQNVIDAIDRTKQNLQPLIQSGKLGPLSGRYEDALAQIGTASPETKKALEDIDVVASLLPATHGMRGTTAYQNFKNSIGGIGQNPQNLFAALDEIRNMSSDIAQNNGAVRFPSNINRPRNGHPAASSGNPPPPPPAAQSGKVLMRNPKTGNYFQVAPGDVPQLKTQAGYTEVK